MLWFCLSSDATLETLESQEHGGVVAGKDDVEIDAMRPHREESKGAMSLDSETSLKTDVSILISEGSTVSTASTGPPLSLVKEEPTESQVEELGARDKGVHQDAADSVIPSAAISCPDQELVALEKKSIVVESDIVNLEQLPSTASAAMLIEHEGVSKISELTMTDMHEENTGVIEQVSLSASEADDELSSKYAEQGAPHVSDVEIEEFSLEDTPTASHSETAAGSEGIEGSEVVSLEESGVSGIDEESVDENDVADVQDTNDERVLEIPLHSGLDTCVTGDIVIPSQQDSATALNTTEDIPQTVEVASEEDASQLDSLPAETVVFPVEEVQSRDTLGTLERTSDSIANVSENLRPVEHVELAESDSSKVEDVLPSVAEELGSDVQVTSLLTSTSGASTTAVVEATNAIESEADAVEPAVVGNPTSGLGEGPKVGSRKKKSRKEFLARADAAGNTADLYNAYKAPEEKKSVEVKRAEVSGVDSSGDDPKDPAVTPDKSIPNEVDDWEDAAELPTPTISLPHVMDTGDRKYTRDFLMTFRDQNRDYPSNFEIRHDIADVLVDKDKLFSEGMNNPARNLDRQPSGGQRLERRGSGIHDDDRWIRQPGLVPSPGRNQPGDARMGMDMSGNYRSGPGMQSGLISQLPQQWPGMPAQAGFPGLIPRGPGNVPIGHYMTPGQPARSPNGVDGDRWLRQPMSGAKGPGLIPSPRTPLPAIHKAENRYEVGKVSDEEQAKQRLIKGILNKLTPQNFDKLFVQVQEAKIDSATTLTGVISQIFDKALMEPTFCEMYAEFCVKLAADLPEFNENDEKITFKRVLLNKCQEEFERGEREQQEAEKDEEEHVEVKMTAEEREEKRLKARRRMLGNIRFIGELYKKSMLTERIMHECIKKLLGEYQNPDEEDVEALCKLMSTIGRIIDHHKAKEHIDAYFRRMESLSNNSKLSARIRFMLKDVIELRRNDWQERRKVDGPKKIDEVRRDAVQERQNASRGDRLGRGPSMGGGGSRGRMGPGPDFGMRGPPSPMYSPGPMGAGELLTIFHILLRTLRFLLMLHAAPAILSCAIGCFPGSASVSYSHHLLSCKRLLFIFWPVLSCREQTYMAIFSEQDHLWEECEGRRLHKGGCVAGVGSFRM